MNQLSIFETQQDQIQTQKELFVVIWQDEKVNPFTLVTTKELTMRQSKPMNQTQMKNFVNAIKTEFSIWYYIEIKKADSNEPAFLNSFQNPILS